MKRPNSRFSLFTETRETSPTAPQSMNFYATLQEMYWQLNIVVMGTAKGNPAKPAFIVMPTRATNT